jgi:hypothetical protein
MVRVVLCIALLLISNLPLSAHHGWYDVDWSRRVTVTGTVKVLQLVGPHSLIDVEVKGAIWKVELVTPLGLTRLGIPHEGLQPGQTITMTVVPYQGKDKEFRAEELTAGGKTASLLPPGTKPPLSPGGSPQFPDPPPGTKPPQ